ncbi:hypothetical protein PR048_033705 [Dryococelus australis]|uniref:PiggyBac transposable element-derived protein domain-containing protein n=1 Tax=Dryococelus australis TaxID=614101 RepID=A0ABQ9G128_9NEOP|nr:hypothetical protein PR048_033705 [Dryococelus australis]
MRQIIVLQSGKDNTAVDTSCGDVVDWKWEQSLVELMCHPFTGVSGIAPYLNLDNNSSRAAIFLLYLNDNIVEHIVEQINKYGSSDSTFVSTTPDEFQVYLALLILMGIIHKPTLQSYWSKEVTEDTPYSRSVMPRLHFVALNKYLHLVDNKTLDPADSLRKICPIITTSSNSFQAVYTLPGSMCINEPLMKCRGRLHFIQYNKSKQKTDGTPASTAIVMEMMQKCDLLNKGYSLYIDNWYSSPELVHRLFSAGTNVCGTVHTNRKHMPKELAKEKLKVGEAVAYKSGKVHRKMQIKIVKPTAVIDYNMKMRGVDVGDQILSKCHVMRRHSKAYKKIFFYVVDMML